MKKLLCLILLLAMPCVSRAGVANNESAWFMPTKAAASEAAWKALVNLEPGVDFMAYDADLAALAVITYSANMQSFLAAANYGAMRTQLSLVPGTDVQAYDADLLALAAISGVQGDVVYHNGTSWVRLPAGTSGRFLQTQGAGANPLWAAVAGGGDLLASNNLSELTASASTARANLGLVIGTDFLAYPTGTPTGSKFLRDDNSWQTISGGGDALVANPLSQFAATTSAQLFGVVSDETGSGTGALAVFNLTPSFKGTAVNGAVIRLVEATDSGANYVDLVAQDSLSANYVVQLPASSGTLYVSAGTDVAVTDGGTGRSTSTTAYGLIAAGTTATGAHQTLAAGLTTELLVGGGASALPVWTTATGSGAPVRATSPTLVTPVLVAATATTVNGLTVTTTSSGVLTIPNSVTLTGPASSGTAATLGNAETFSGAKTFSSTIRKQGVTITDATAMGALQIDVTKPLNTKSVAADSTFTFSGTPATAETLFAMRLNNTDTARHTMTIPSSLVDGVATTTFTLDASSECLVTWVYDGGSYHLYGAPLTVNDLTADTVPTTSDYRQTWDASAAKHKKVAEGTLPLVSVETGEIADDAVTAPKLANMAQNTIKGRVTGSTGDPEDLSAANVLTILESGGSNILLASEVDTASEADALMQLPVEICIAASDETTAITTGTAKATFRAPYAFTVTAVRMSLTTVSSSGLPTVDINEGGTTIISTKLTCDASEKTSTTAATPAVISDAAIADDAEITIDFDVAGTGATGVKVWILGYR